MKFSLLKAALFSAPIAFLTAAPLQADQSFSAWNKEVRKEIEEKHSYPQTAINKGIQGRVKVRLTVSEAGTVKGIQIVESSGSEILDTEALYLATRLKNLPALPSNGDHSIVVPLTYRLAGV